MPSQNSTYPIPPTHISTFSFFVLIYKRTSQWIWFFPAEKELYITIYNLTNRLWNREVKPDIYYIPRESYYIHIYITLPSFSLQKEQENSLRSALRFQAREKPRKDVASPRGNRNSVELFDVFPWFKERRKRKPARPPEQNEQLVLLGVVRGRTRRWARGNRSLHQPSLRRQRSGRASGAAAWASLS